MTRTAELISYVTTLMNSNDTTTSVFSTAQGGALTERENGNCITNGASVLITLYSPTSI